MFVLFIHHLLLSARTRFVAMSDEDLQRVVATTAKTMETRAKGIVYSHPSGTPHLDKAAEWLAQVVSERGNIASAPDVSDRDAATVLESMARAIRDHAATGAPAGYLETAERVLASSLGGTPPIELPDSVGGLDESPSDRIVAP